MGFTATPTPNPNAMKIVIGQSVGGPGTVNADSDPEEQYLADLATIDGIASVFFTADFFTITKSPPSDWDAILAQAMPILEERFGG